jgi:hypothetical protein
MITIKTTGSSIGGLGLGSDSLFRQEQMMQLGKLGIQDLKRRTALGLGSDDQRMKPLKPGRAKATFSHRDASGPHFISSGYAAWKVKHGLVGMRDLIGIGQGGSHMWDKLSVRLATETLVRIAFTTVSSRQKAKANEQRDPFFSWSPSNQETLRAAAEKMFGENVRNMGVTRALQIFSKRKAA